MIWLTRINTRIDSIITHATIRMRRTARDIGAKRTSIRPSRKETSMVSLWASRTMSHLLEVQGGSRLLLRDVRLTAVDRLRSREVPLWMIIPLRHIWKCHSGHMARMVHLINLSVPLLWALDMIEMVKSRIQTGRGHLRLRLRLILRIKRNKVTTGKRAITATEQRQELESSRMWSMMIRPRLAVQQSMMVMRWILMILLPLITQARVRSLRRMEHDPTSSRFQNGRNNMTKKRLAIANPPALLEDRNTAAQRMEAANSTLTSTTCAPHSLKAPKAATV